MSKIKNNKDLARHNSGSISNTNEAAFILAKKVKKNAALREERLNYLEKKVSNMDNKLDTLIKLLEVKLK